MRGDAPDVAKVWQLHLGDLEKLAGSGDAVTDADLETRRSAANGKDMATLIYTSGSTGTPKGCILTHSNFVDLSRNGRGRDGRGREHAGRIHPALHHDGARLRAFHLDALGARGPVRVGHQADTKKLVESLGSFKPTFLLAVPRVFEKVYNSAEQKAVAGGKGNIFHAAVDTAIAHSKALDAGKVPLGLKIKFALFDRLVYGKLKAVMGGNVKYAVSGGAPLGTRLGHFFRSLDVKILEGYGLTETSAPATVNRAEKFKIGTVGPALPGNGIKIAEDGEVLVKGIAVFDGYWKNEAATKETFDGEWFKTGDLGELDDDGYLSITGRKKEIIVTAAGKNVAPTALEDPIRANPIIGQIIVVGDQKPFISALVTLDSEMLPPWLNSNGEAADMSLADAAVNPKVIAEVQKAVDAANAKVSRAESIRKFTILATEFTEGSGHLTPKMSLKRGPIMKDFATQVEAMYEQPATKGESLVH